VTTAILTHVIVQLIIVVYIILLLQVYLFP